MYMFTYTTPTFVTEALCLSYYSSTAAFNNCYSELTPYTMVANSYCVIFHDAYQCQGHAHSQ